MFDFAIDREENASANTPAVRQTPVTQGELQSMFQDLLQGTPSLEDFSTPQLKSDPADRLQRIARRRRLEALAAVCSAKAQTILDEDADVLNDAKALMAQPALNQTTH